MKMVTFIFALLSIKLLVISNVFAATESPLVVELAKQSQTTNEMARKQIEQVVLALKSELLAGRDVTLKNFGRFYVSELGPREVRNPKTGDKLQIGARKYPRFTSSDNFKAAFNGVKEANTVKEAKPGEVQVVK